MAEIPALIHGQEAYLSITDVFDFLRIKNSPSSGYDSIMGFFIRPEETFLIDGTVNQIVFHDKVFKLKPDDLIRTESGLYLKVHCFGEVFGLNCLFNFRALSVTLTTKLELPAIREMKLAELRRNISHLKGEIHTDTIVGRTYPLFHFGAVDWSISSTQQLQSESSTRFNLAFGGF